MAIGVGLLVALQVLKGHNYLLFHNLAEIFSVIIASSIFIVTWNTRRITDNGCILVLGIAFLFVGLVDLLHTFAYKGMGIFANTQADLATQLWIGARYIAALAFVAAPLALRRRPHPYGIFAVGAVLTTLFLLSVFRWNNFPACFIEGEGLTPFKLWSEYVISALFLTGLFLVWRRRAHFDPGVLRWLMAAILVTVFSELFFTLYADPFSTANVLGHYLKIVSFAFFYRALLETTLVRPFDLLFRNLKASEEKYRTLYAAEADAVLLLDADTLQLQEANDAAVRLYGYSREGLLSLKATDLSAEPERTAAYLRAGTVGETSRIQLRHHRRKDGTVIPVEISTSFFKLGGRRMAHAALRDISERLASQQALESYTRQLEAANAELKSFAYSVSHDLRTPLRAIGGFSAILHEEHAAQLNAEGRECLTHVRRGVQRMEQLIQGLLAFSRVGRMEMRNERVEMEALAAEAWDEVRLGAEERDVRFTLQPLPAARGDATMIRQVFTNLLDNALKFTASSNPANITVEGAREGDMNRYTVRDNGIGFSMEYAERIFEVFQRLHVEEEYEGTGAGLAIVRRIVTRHGGRIWAESAPGEGAAFHFTLPAGE